MPQLDNFSNGQSHTQDTLSDKLSREGSLLAGVPDNAWSGLKARAEDSWSHKLETGAEVVGSFALGAGLSMALKNPELAAVARFAPLIGSALVATDVAKRVGAPMVETWSDPNSLARNKVRLGANIGAMAYDYTLMGASGVAGAHFGPGLAGKLMGVSTASESSGLALSRITDPVRFEPSAAGAGAKIGGTPMSRDALAELLKPSNLHANLGASDAMSMKLGDLKFDPAKLGVLTTTKTVGLPEGSEMGLGVASVADMARPRNDTKLGALTEITPFRANVNEALKGLQYQGGEMFKRLNADQATFQDHSRSWLKLLDKQVSKTTDNQ